MDPFAFKLPPHMAPEGIAGHSRGMFFGGCETVLGSLDVSHYILLVVSVVGFLLASFTEDAACDSLRLSWIATQLLPTAQYGESPQLGSDELAKTGVHLTLTRLAERKRAKWLSAFLQPYRVAYQKGCFLSLLYERARQLHRQIEFYCSCAYFKQIAEGTRHFSYMVIKYRLGLQVKRGETEVDSYNSAKAMLQKQHMWPYMLEVSGVKDDLIVCDGKTAYPMSSYSYLDFIREPLVQAAAIETAQRWATGAHGARMLGGNSSILRDLERAVGKFFGREDSLVCASGYLATMSVACVVGKKGDLMVADHRAHASLRAGMTLCGAKTLFFRHNDYAHLRELLVKYRSRHRNCWILIESVYSMEGDIGDLPTVRKLADTFGAKIICDEAHGLGILGKTGRGLEEHFGMPGSIDVICGTFSKSIASVGGFIVCTPPLLQFLDFHTPGNVFSAPLTAYSAGGAIKAFELMCDDQMWRVHKTQSNAMYLRSLIETGAGHWPVEYPEEDKYEVEGMGCTAVIPVVYPNDADRLFRITMLLLDRGYMVAPAVFPACPLNRPRIRVTATAAYSKEVMDQFVEALVKATVETVPSNRLARKRSE